MRTLQASPAACPGAAHVGRARELRGSAVIACLGELGGEHRGLRGVTRDGGAARVVARHDCRAQARHRPAVNRTRRRERAHDQGRAGDRDAFAMQPAGSIACCRSSSRVDPRRRERTAANGRRHREGAMREAGYERMAFDTIVASGPHSAMPHYRAGTRVLTAGDLVVLDFGGVLDGYCCDLTRTVKKVDGTHPRARQRRVYDAVHDMRTRQAGGSGQGPESTRPAGGRRGARGASRPRAGRCLRAWHRTWPRPGRTRRASRRQSPRGPPRRRACARHGLRTATSSLARTCRDSAACESRMTMLVYCDRLQNSSPTCPASCWPSDNNPDELRRDQTNPRDDARARALRVRARARELQAASPEAFGGAVGSRRRPCRTGTPAARRPLPPREP